MYGSLGSHSFSSHLLGVLPTNCRSDINITENSREVSNRHDSSSLTPVSPEDDDDIKAKQDTDPTPITPTLLSYIRGVEPAPKKKPTPLQKRVNQPRMNKAYELRVKATKTKSTDLVTKIDKGPRTKKTSNKQKVMNRGLNVGQTGKADRVKSNSRSSTKNAKDNSVKYNKPSKSKKCDEKTKKEREIKLTMIKPGIVKKSKRKTNAEEKMADTKSAAAEPRSPPLQSMLPNQSACEGIV